MPLSLTFDLTQLQKEVEDEMRNKIKQQIYDKVYAAWRVYFATKDQYVNSFKDGEGTKYINSATEDLLLSEKTADIVKKTVEKDWQNIVEETTRKAMRHRANKMVFNSPEIRELDRKEK